MGVSDQKKDEILDALFDGTLGPAEQHLALVTAPVTGADKGTTIKEPTYTGYARIPLKNTDMAAASAAAKMNSVLKEFAECTAGEDIVVGWASCTEAGTKAGDVVSSGVIPPTLVKAGIKPKFEPGALVLRAKDGS